MCHELPLRTSQWATCVFSTLEHHVVAGSGRGSILNPHQILGDLIEAVGTLDLGDRSRGRDMQRGDEALIENARGRRAGKADGNDRIADAGTCRRADRDEAGRLDAGLDAGEIIGREIGIALRQGAGRTACFRPSMKCKVSSEIGATESRTSAPLCLTSRVNTTWAAVASVPSASVKKPVPTPSAVSIRTTAQPSFS